MTRIRIQGIYPRKPVLVDRRKLESEMNGALNKTANLIRNDFRKTVRTWNDKPTFRKDGPRHGAVDIFTTHRIYFFLNDGTRKNYPIPKSGRRLLSFRAGYNAKTRPRVIGSRGGGPFGPRVFAQRVTHPGIEARKFDEVIRDRRQKTLNKFVRIAVLRVSKS